MSKASKCVRVNITVPGDLKAKMEAMRGVNWSAVAARAFRAVVDAGVPPPKEEKLSLVVTVEFDERTVVHHFDARSAAIKILKKEG